MTSNGFKNEGVITNSHAIILDGVSTIDKNNKNNDLNIKAPQTGLRRRKFCLIIISIILIILLTLLLFTILATTFALNAHTEESPNYIQLGIFDEPNATEYAAVAAFLAANMSAKRQENVTKLTEIFILSISLFRPNKHEVLNYLQNSSSGVKRPMRCALVRVIMGNLKTPAIHEYKVWPLSHPQSIELLDTIDISKRPISVPENFAMDIILNATVTELKPFLMDIYNASVLDCIGPNCLSFMMTTAIITEANPIARRITVFRLSRKVHPMEHYGLDLYIAVNHDTLNTSNWRVDEINFQGHHYPNSSKLMNSYNKGRLLSLRKTTYDNFYEAEFTENEIKDSGETLFPESNRIEIAVDEERRVSYERWSFYPTILKDTGLRVYDIRFNNIPIAYEVGLTETATFYSGLSPFTKQMRSVESMFAIGGLTGELIPGVDCPAGSRYLPINVETSFGSLRHIRRAICLFEWLGGMATPLARHVDYSSGHKHNNFTYAHASLDRCLVVRSIVVLFNYDYIFDLVLHQSGGMEMSVTPTGYAHLDPTPKHHPNSRRGFPYRGSILDENIDMYGPLHLHLFHFKLDLDPVSPDNNYFTSINFLNPVDGVNLIHTEEKPRQNELDAQIKFNFSEPKLYLLCEGNYDSNKAMVDRRCLRIQNKGKVNADLLKGNDGAIEWARHQISVTLINDNEHSSSSIYNGVDLVNPQVKFSQFSADNENILNKDLIVWLTMGGYHLPRREDIFNTVTDNGRLSIIITPFNLFPRSPSPNSHDQFMTQSKDKWNKMFKEL